MRKLKKGFTIIELVIVIAVIAVLTAVLVPTFVHLSKKARDTNDKSIVTSANIQLAAQEGLQGKNRSMSEAVKDVDEIGYHMSTVPTGNGNKIVWDSVTDRFVLLDKDNNVLLSDGEVSSHDKLFYAVSSISEAGDFAIYAKSNFDLSVVNFSSAKSFDAGEKVPTVGHEDNYIESISYGFNDAGNVLVVTNSAETTLNVNTPNADFEHVGLCKKILIETVDDDTFKDHGHVGYVEIDSGHYVADSGSNIKAVYATSDNAKVDKQNGGQIENACGGAASYTGDNSKGNVELDFNDNKAAVEEQALKDLDHEINPATVIVEEIGTWAQLIAFTERDDERTGVITADIDFELFPLEIKGDKTIDLAGHTLALANGVYDSANDVVDGCLIYVLEGSTLILNDSSGTNAGKLKYKSVSGGGGNDDSGTFLICNEGNLIINGGTYEGAISDIGTEYGLTLTVSHGVLINFNHATINGGVFIKKNAILGLVNYVFLNGYSRYWVSQEDTAKVPVLELVGGTYTNQKSSNNIVRNLEHPILEKAKGLVLDGNGDAYDSTKVTDYVPIEEYAKDGIYTMDPQSCIRGYVEDQAYTPENNYTISITDSTISSDIVEWSVTKSGSTYTVSHIHVDE